MPMKHHWWEVILECTGCGHRVSEACLSRSSRYRRRTLPAVTTPPDAAEPAEHVIVCPECTRVDSFQEALDSCRSSKSSMP